MKRQNTLKGLKYTLQNEKTYFEMKTSWPDQTEIVSEFEGSSPEKYLQRRRGGGLYQVEIQAYTKEHRTLEKMISVWVNTIFVF